MAATAHSLLDRYARPVKTKQAPRVTPIVIDDPYAADFPASLRVAPAGVRTRHPREPASTEKEWHAPARKPIEVLASARDIVAGMYARRQIDRAMFLAARNYQELYEEARSARIKTVDPSMTAVSGGGGERDVVGKYAASQKLARIETRLARRYGAEAVAFCAEVLGGGLTIERAALRRDGGGKQDVAWWGGQFRRCLKEMAEISGFAVKGAYRNRARVAAREEKRRRKEDA